MLVVSLDRAWLTRLERIAQKGGWPYAPREALPSSASSEHALVLVDRAFAGRAPLKAVASLRAGYPHAVIALVFGANELSREGAAAAVACGADDVLDKTWTDAKLALRIAGLRDRALASQARFSADGGLRAEKRAHRAYVRSRGRWKELVLDGCGFALLWRLLERGGETVSREELGAALAAAAGREREASTVARRVAALRAALKPWAGSLESARGGLYRLTPRSR